MEEFILLILELIGTVAFAVSGAFVAMRAKLDIFGVVFIGCITSVGGGILRDLLIGVTPPAIFARWYILLAAALTSALVFILAYVSRKQFDDVHKKLEPISNLFDAIGLAAFSVAGTEIAFCNGLSNNVLLSVLLGMLTGVGGGIMRDILTDTTPYIFKKHVYALASIGGALVYYVLRVCVEGTLVASAVGMLLVVVVRILAAKYHWSLPKVQWEEEPSEK